MLPSRRALTLLAAAAAVSSARLSGDAEAQAGACRRGDAGASNALDMTVGAADAPLHLIVYISATCPHCAAFHHDVWPRLKANYVDAGTVRLTFRELATAPASVALAEFQLARCGCASPEEYVTRLDVLFALQDDILGMGSMQGVLQSLVAIGEDSGLSEAEVTACVGDSAGVDRITRSITQAQTRYGVSSTPDLVLDGRRIDDPAATTYDGLARILDASLARRGG